jgi:hypothetical protein
MLEDKNKIKLTHVCEFWYLTLREKHRLKVFENKMLRMVLEPKTDAITGD